MLRGLNHLTITVSDLDGHKLEIHSGSLESRLDSLKQQPYKGLVWFNDS